jgi:hypothetical protein
MILFICGTIRENNIRIQNETKREELEYNKAESDWEDPIDAFPITLEDIHHELKSLRNEMVFYNE